MKAGILSIILYLCIGVSNNAFAYYSMYPSPPLYNVNNETIRQSFTLGYWDPKDPRLFPCGPRPTGNPELFCDFRLIISTSRGETIETVENQGFVVVATSGFKTFGELAANNLNINTQNVYVVYRRNLWEPGLCARLMVNKVPIEGNSCVQLPPVDSGVCDFKTSYITLPHNIVYRDAIDGNKAAATITIDCEHKPSNIRIKLFEAMTKSNEVKLRPDGSLFSKLKINGVDGETGISISNAIGSHTFEISSTLRSVGQPATGAFSGSGVAVMEYY
ncbi:TPA: PapG chaperone-binding domain-containing protein [Serratia marcescens]